MVSSPAFSLGNTEYSHVALKLPKLRLPEAPSSSSVLGIQASPRTPRRKIGRLNAGAALTFFTVPELSSAASYDPRGCSPSSSPSASPITSPVHPCLKVRGTFSLESRSSVFASGSHKSLNGQNHQRTISGVHRSKPPARTCARAQSSEGESEGRATRDGLTTKEKSQMVNEELLLFFFQLDLGTRLQRAMNQEQYEAAGELREKIVGIEKELEKQRRAKRAGTGPREEVTDTTVAALRLRSELQRAVEEENYEQAAAIRKQLSKIELDALAATAQTLTSTEVKFNFRLGQKIRHAQLGYRGVICGMDWQCFESSEWMEKNGVDNLPRGRQQPFYQVLVDMQQSPSTLVAYVAEENVEVPEEEDEEPFPHPYLYLLFYGQDANGDFIPTKQLREKYDAPRHELPYDPPEEDSTTSES
ncbi:UVR domain containing protein [Klebsormidium nitens]|uniref:UVR domain containing protein n=1 Tax=Klebsormidium nitens TaxID=105231 RepID=A0A1Y1II31_KLENI|nr:UVR domain containing protein [Klebsormidium nitens]|eukprot:GAQ88307.1 UVR domain containing protein [Klebsormidium nitens]